MRTRVQPISLDAFSCDARQIIHRNEAGTPVTVGEVDVTEPYDSQLIRVGVFFVELSGP